VKKIRLSEEAMAYLQLGRSASAASPVAKSQLAGTPLVEQKTVGVPLAGRRRSTGTWLPEQKAPGSPLVEIATDDLSDVCKCECRLCGRVMDSHKAKNHLDSRHGLKNQNSSSEHVSMVRLTYHWQVETTIIISIFSTADTYEVC
jgi:hypothetical protein